MTVLYKLAEEQLSKQNHYDWGLRSLNAVLRMAGVKNRTAHGLEEDALLMQVLRDMNLPKFVFDDVPLFLGLIKVGSSITPLQICRQNLHWFYVILCNVGLVPWNRLPQTELSGVERCHCSMSERGLLHCSRVPSESKCSFYWFIIIVVYSDW